MGKKRKKKGKKKGLVPTDQGFMDTSWDAGWWQQNLKPKTSGANETVEACVSALAQTVAMCPAYHLQTQDDGEVKRLSGSYVERVLLNPNSYTSRSLFFTGLVRSTYFRGNGFAVTGRNANNAIDRLYLVDPGHINGVVDPESGEAFYWIGSVNGTFDPDQDAVYGGRNVLNLRIIPRHDEPLKGDTPITAAANSIAANSAITHHQSEFFENMGRPSGILSTPEILKAEQMNQLREAYNAQTQGKNSGKVPILGGGIKFEQMSLTSQDAQLVEAHSMTVENISRVFRVPLALINSMENSTLNNAESTMNWFLSSGLGFLLEHIELELNRLFSLPFNEKVNFDTTALLRSDRKTRMETLSIGTLGGILSPNEARKEEGKAPAVDGDEPRVQQQVVPLSAWNVPDPEPEPEPIIDVTAAFNKGYANARKAS